MLKELIHKLSQLIHELREDRRERHRHHKQKVRIWIITFDPDEPLKKEQQMKLSKPIAPGFRRPFIITPDEPVDKRSDGSFLGVEVLSGNSTVTVDPSSTPTSLKGWINGDGDVGQKSVRLTVDGHIGEGETPVTLDVDFEVTTPDATSIANLVEGADEPIPAA
jgi:hypothetical protein